MKLLHQLQENTIVLIATIGAFLLPIKPLIILVGVVIALDTFTGLWKAIKLKQKITSRKLSNVISKMILYQGAVLTIFFIEHLVLGEFVGLFVQIPFFLTKVLAIVLVGIETISMHENFETISGINIWKTFKKLVSRANEAKNDIVELTDFDNKKDEDMLEG